MKHFRRRGLSEKTLLAAMMLLAAVLLFAGWRIFWFLTDDAYIAFRYVSNSRLGYGYVWNAPPFLPVEGYTSFLWVVLLDCVWRALGVDPPASVNWIALGFSYGTLLIATALVMRIRWWGQRQRSMLLFVVPLLLFLVLNRTFLAWSSSGLETAMMAFFILGWVYVCVADWSPPRKACLASLAAVALALTRPDGLLFCGGTVLLVLLAAFSQSQKRYALKTLVCGFLPFAIVLAHIAWRVSFYGAWVPNTYYAKVVKAWPESGLRYIMSFVLEYALWLPIGIAVWALVRGISGGWSRFRSRPNGETSLSMLRDASGRVASSLVAVGTLLLQCGYYTFVVGGDHFEYRVYAHLVPLVFVALVWSLNRLRLDWYPAVAVAWVFLLLSMPVQWTHWVVTKDLTTRMQTHTMRVPIAHYWPRAVRWYANVFDEAQSWLIYHHVCMRHQEHKVFWQFQVGQWPTREQGLKLPRHGYPVIVANCVGVPSWVLPHVSVIDGFGLNDYVIARTPVPAGSKRYMAHERRPPKGYVESYSPNLHIRGDRQVILADRPEALTGPDIAANEQHWRSRIKTIEQEN